MARLKVLRAVGLAAAAAVLAGGCATVPTVGQPRAVIGATGQVPQLVQPIPPVPQPNWGPNPVVQGFLAASASFAGQHAAAQKFLTPSARQMLHLGSWPVTVVTGPLNPTSTTLGPAGKGPPGLMLATLHTQQVATISDTGQYVYAPAPHTYHFTLTRTNGVWRISGMSPPALVLSQDSFQDVYQPRNLYFWSPGYQSPVPEPVFAPQQDTYAEAAAGLVNALLRTNQDPGTVGQQDRTWLAGATQTAFRLGTTLVGNKVTIEGQTAIVNLRGAATRATSYELRLMAQQLIATLTSTSYSSPAIARHVELEVNGQLRDTREPSLRAAAQSPGPLYYLAANDAVSMWNGSGGKPVRTLAGRYKIPFTQKSEIAVLSDPAAEYPLFAGAVPSGQGCGIYHGPIAGHAPLALSVVPDPDAGPCTSVSWDSQGDIWAVTAGHIWVLASGKQQFTEVVLPPLPGGSRANYQVGSVRVAPDAVRVAMLVQVPASGRPSSRSQVVMAAVRRVAGQFMLGSTVAVGPTLLSPAALSWLDPDHLVVLSRSELYSVPVNGGTPVPIDPAPQGANSVTATDPGHIVVSGGGQMSMSSGQEQLMQNPKPGDGASYQQ